jgi:hypothetical protein
VRQPAPTPTGSDHRRRADDKAAQVFIRLHADLSLGVVSDARRDPTGAVFRACRHRAGPA